MNYENQSEGYLVSVSCHPNETGGKWCLPSHQCVASVVSFVISWIILFTGEACRASVREDLSVFDSETAGSSSE